MPILAIHPADANGLYKLIEYPDSWTTEPEDIFLALQALSKDTVIQDRKLLKKVNNAYLPYVRPSMRVAIIFQAHIDTGHRGIAKTHEWLFKNFYWENMCLLIPDVLSSCHSCQLQQP
ncbi:hypothetical protein DSO57_1022025 [Entomophthora muscae]|uniref:Uncharacterized protein n=1 Tax=Entomophthora muscae TaxID=34485 RepID=A0ACC2UCY5_9FUNG|nr:hypothetical protein DSO57_1022025 [Entomophthora muscae]